MSKGRVLVAMSGGVDSSVAALLLIKEGYEIVGVTLKTWEYSSTCHSGKETGCCSIDSFNDARTMAVNLGFPHYIIDVQKEFEENIIQDFIKEYLAGRTPNPCVRCNTFIKWDLLLKKADQLNCDFIATGHYAQIKNSGNRYYISKGLDETKDQSYVLWGLTQENLKRTLFPLGNYNKADIKKIAVENGFKYLSDKRESYEICFVPGNEYRDFLKTRIPDLENRVKGGKFVSSTGEFLGFHKGFPFYTIGQRKGLEVAVGHPLYVTRIDPQTNTITLGEKDELYQAELFVSDLNLMKYAEINKPINVLVKVRYKDKGTEGVLNVADNKAVIKFNAPVSAITPGQSAVFFEGDDLIGGGIIN